MNGVIASRRPTTSASASSGDSQIETPLEPGASTRPACDSSRQAPKERGCRQAEALQASIADQVDQLRNSEQWTRYLQFARSFYPYSVNNLILIMTQFPTASRVAGFRQWQAKGRQVRKGEKSIKIFGLAQKKL